MPQQLRPMILFSEALTRFRNRGCESLHFERLNEHIEQLIQNQWLDRRARNFRDAALKSGVDACESVSQLNRTHRSSASRKPCSAMRLVVWSELNS